MSKYACMDREYIYGSELGDPENGVPPGTPFEDLPDTWVCPICKEGKYAFARME
ncbi:MAG: rubredoxin [Chloroflexi bacterium]|nr:rubredoxin [Chloroflexota bacterium]